MNPSCTTGFKTKVWAARKKKKSSKTHYAQSPAKDDSLLDEICWGAGKEKIKQKTVLWGL